MSGLPPPEETPEDTQAAGAYRTTEETRDSTSRGEPSRVEDIVPGQLSSGPHGLRDVKGTLFFGATDVEHGTELWKSDGTPGGTRVVEDIRTGPEGSTPGLLCALDGAVLFVADDGAHGAELWRSDGTPGGTRMVKDINPGAGGSSPFIFTRRGGQLIFVATDEEHGRELWLTDGTERGTRLAVDIFPGPESFGINELVATPEQIIFRGHRAAAGHQARTGLLVPDSIGGVSGPSSSRTSHLDRPVEIPPRFSWRLGGCCSARMTAPPGSSCGCATARREGHACSRSCRRD